MKVALLTCGESVFQGWDPDWDPAFFDAVVGVNWICCHYDLDWLCVKDRCVLDDPRFRRPKVGYAMKGGLPMRDKGELDYEDMGNWNGVNGWSGRVSCQYTFPDALRWVLQRWKDAEVSVFGLDMNDAKGACRDNWRHDAARWKAELPYIRGLFKAYGERIRLVDCEVDEGLLRV